MRKTLKQRVTTGETLGEVERKDLIFDGRSSSPDVAHFLSVLALSGDTGFEPPVLWLDGSNSFDPYRVSELSRSLGLDPGRVLEEIYISRAFTCYQMKSLILNELEDAVERFGSGFTVITGLPELFSGSDLVEKEALRVFDPVIETLKSFRKSGPTLFLASPTGGEENMFITSLRSVSDHVLGPDQGESRAGNSSGDPSRIRRKNTGSGPPVGTRSLEEFG
ncbi:hypothetical protein AKJ62_02755 [candidate division MSBL1 archaeon SCGC-AAA259D14]|uniref:Rad51-like C-terminal domain-containing protein n=1 Tax=candidate division MSBL1 archaeon SCGC-AAA259D14 TaxID=1698261 RepID=A0A133U5X8_9EURY|nr:hypothetical protein AKJ62_02755 [candidate division MSBL1 archaeon SCGC-AAA259D14]